MPMRRLGRLKPEEKRSRQAVDLFGCSPCPPSLPQLSRSRFFYSISPPRLRLASLAMGKSRSGVLLALLLVCAAVAAAAAAAVPGSKGTGGAGRAEVACSDLATRGECVASGGGSRCRWCRSEALDDMCFGAAEAWRLPNQVFSCDPPAGGAAHARR